MSFHFYVIMNMNKQNNALSDRLKTTLKELFDDTATWTNLQTKSYELLRTYQETNRKKYQTAQHYNDKQIISNNIKGQSWYQVENHCIKTIISQLIDQMNIISEHSINQPDTKMLNLLINFNQFNLNVFYFQQINEIINLQIYVSRNQKKNYLAYYIRGRIAAIPNQIRDKIQVPELNGLNNLIAINETMISAELLLNFFLEIILYYDQTETIESLKLMEDHDKTIKELLESDTISIK